jgi:hypothetical protein
LESSKIFPKLPLIFKEFSANEPPKQAPQAVSPKSKVFQTKEISLLFEMVKLSMRLPENFLVVQLEKISSTIHESSAHSSNVRGEIEKISIFSKSNEIFTTLSKKFIEFSQNTDHKKVQMNGHVSDGKFRANLMELFSLFEFAASFPNNRKTITKLRNQLRLLKNMFPDDPKIPSQPKTVKDRPNNG